MLAERVDYTLIELAGYIQASNLTDLSNHEKLYNQMAQSIARLSNDTTKIMPYEVAVSYFRGMHDGSILLGDSNKEADEMIKRVTEDLQSMGNISRNIHVEAINEIMEDSLIDLDVAYRTFEQNALSSVDEVLDKVRNEIAGSFVTGESRASISQRVADAFLSKGLTSFVTSDGKKLPVDVYSRTVVNTKKALADAEGHLNRYRERGIDIVKFTTGRPTCEECGRHRGLTYSMSGESEYFEALPDKLIPLHNHCRCTWSPVSIRYKTDDELREMAKRNVVGYDDQRPDSEKDLYDKQQYNKRKLNQSKKMLSKMRNTIPDDIGNMSFEKFHDIKQNDENAYKEIYGKYLSKLHQIRKDNS